MSQRRPWFRLLPLVTLTFIACGGSTTEEAPPPPELGLAVSETVTLVPGGVATIPLTLTRNEAATGEVRFSVEGLPTGVTASFDPPAVTGTALQTTLQLTAEREAEQGQFLAHIRAEGPGALVTERAFALAVRGLTINGTLQATLYDAPPERSLIRVGDRWVVSGADGRFTVPDVLPPYELEVSYVSSDGRFVTEIFHDLTTPSPRITGLSLGPRMPPGPSALIQGTVSPPPAAGEVVTLCVSSPHPVASRCTDAVVDGSGATFQMQVDLFNPVGEDVLLVARRYLAGGASAAPTAFNGYAEAPLRLAPGVTTSVDLALAPGGSTRVDLSVEAPAGATAVAVKTFVPYGTHLAVGWESAPGQWSVAKPEDGEAWVTVEAHFPDWAQLVVVQPADAGPVQFPEPPELLAPGEGAAITADTEFVSAAGPGVRTNIFGFTHDRMVAIHTTRDRVPFPSIEDGPRPDQLVEWAVIHTSAPENTDAFLHVAQLIPMLTGALEKAPVAMPVSPVSYGVTASRRFQ